METGGTASTIALAATWLSGRKLCVIIDQGGAEINLPAGYTVRPGTPDDIAEIAQQLNTWRVETTGRSGVNEERFRQWLSRIDLGRSSRIVRDVEGVLAAWTILFDAMAPHTELSRMSHTAGAHQDLGIGTALHAWSVALAREGVARAPERKRVVLTETVPERDTAARTFLECHGFELCRTFLWMGIDMAEAPPAAAWPEGFRAESFDLDCDLEQLVKAVLEIFADHGGVGLQPLDEMMVTYRDRFLNDPTFSPEYTFMVRRGDELAGFGLIGTHEEDGRTIGMMQAFGVLPAFRRRGLGLAMTQHSLDLYHRNGIDRAILRVDSANRTGASRVYERAGLRVEYAMLDHELELRPAA